MNSLFIIYLISSFIIVISSKSFEYSDELINNLNDGLNGNDFQSENETLICDRNHLWSDVFNNCVYCPTLLTNGSCYFLSDSKLNWNDSINYCKNHHSSFSLKIDSLKELEVIQKISEMIHVDSFWIGAQFDLQSNNLVWIHDENQTEIMDTNANGCASYMNGFIGINFCSIVLHSICEIQIE